MQPERTTLRNTHQIIKIWHPSCQSGLNCLHAATLGHEPLLDQQEAYASWWSPAGLAWKVLDLPACPLVPFEGQTDDQHVPSRGKKNSSLLWLAQPLHSLWRALALALVVAGLYSPACLIWAWHRTHRCLWLLRWRTTSGSLHTRSKASQNSHRDTVGQEGGKLAKPYYMSNSYIS